MYVIILASIEIFDTDFILSDIKLIIKQVADPNNPGATISKTSYQANCSNEMKVGIRLYEPSTKRIIEQKLITNSKTWTSKGVTKLEATMTLAKQLGQDYANRIIPTKVKITRKLYKKNNKVPSLNKGARLCDVSEWKEAIEVWKIGLSTTTKDKHAGFLTYNISVIYEVLGEYDLAIEYAKKSYTLYGNNEASSYVRNLEYRKKEVNKLHKQLK